MTKMPTDKTGGPAFPKAGLDPWGRSMEEAKGMTLRDYFAAKAMATMLTTYNVPDVFDDDTWSKGEPTMPEMIAKDAYTMADAMLKAREA